jgi:hypothetical protein
MIFLFILDPVGKLTDATVEEQPVNQSAGRGGVDKSWFAAERIQQVKADGLAGLRLRGADIEVRGGAKHVGTLGIGDPQSECGELVIIADEVFADERSDGIKFLGRAEV